MPAGRAYTVWDGSPVSAREDVETLGGRRVRTLPALLRAAARVG